MSKVRRPQIIERMKRGGELVTKWTYDQPGIEGGYANPNYRSLGYDSCHVGDVRRMIDKGELVKIDGERSWPYTAYRLAENVESVNA